MRPYLFVLLITMVIAIASLLLLLEEPAPSFSEPVTVIAVIDGDTIFVSPGENVRLIGLDAPHDDEGALATFHYLEELLLFKKVVLEKDVSDRDSHGELLRYVYIDNTMVNELLLREGLASLMLIRPDTRHAQELRAAESAAKDARKGMWH